jgi:long-chain acyl-CoA synthetase
VDRPWLSHYDPGVRAVLDYPDITLPQLFDQAVERHPERVATIFHDAKTRYRDLKRQIDAFAAGLQQRGIRPGDRVAVMLPNVPQFLIAFFGALRAGAIVVPTNPLYTTHELEHQLRDSGAVAVVTLDQLFGALQAALPSTQVRTVIVAGVGPVLPRRLRPFFALQQRHQGVRGVRPGGIVSRFQDLSRTPPLVEPYPVDPDAVALLQYTGGTTGTSKGAMLSHRNLIANALQAYEWQGGYPGARELLAPRILCVTPFFHVYGLTIGMNLAVASGATMLLVPRFSPREILRTAAKYRPQFFPGVPTMYFALASQPDASRGQFSSLLVCISGAAALSSQVQASFAAVSGVHIVEGYGLTEASPVTHSNPVGSGGRAGTVGVPFPDTDATITDPVTWQPLPPGQIGEITVRGPQVMQGYWNRPDETAAVLRDGWLHTGDMGVMEPDGFFRVIERKKDIIIASGFNVYPREVEEVILEHPAVSEVAVVGVPSEYRGETVKAVVVLKAGASATAQEIIAFCRTELAPFKVPTVVEFRQGLPRTLIGKVLRRALREEPAPAAENQQTA